MRPRVCTAARRAHWTASLLATCVVIAAAPAPGQTGPEVVARRRLLDHAATARAAGRFAEALDVYARAGQIRMTPSVRAFIADAQSRVGQLVDALGSAELCLRDLDEAAAVNHREAIEAHCRGLRTDLRRRVGELVVAVPTPAPIGLRVTVGGVELSPGLFGAPAAMMPGEVAVVARVDGVERWRASVLVAAGETATARVVLTPDPVATPVSPPPLPVVATVVSPPAPRPPRVNPPQPSASPARLPRTLAWVAVGGAAAGAVAGTIALVVQRQRAGDFNGNHYPVNACDLTCDAARSSVTEAGTAAWVSYGIGAAAGAAAVVLFVASPPARRATALLGCGPGPGAVGAACAFAF